MSRAQRYPRLILALVCLPVFIGALDLTIVSAVLPDVMFFRMWPVLRPLAAGRSPQLD
jgi:hypothetical protein